MKKRIIALFLVVIMTVLTLASCGSYNLAKEDLTKYTDGKFDVEKFVKALQNLEIEDEEYTTNEATQKKVVAAAIYDAVASGIISEATASNGYFADDKLTSGKIGKNDVVYYCYYFSVDTDKDPATPDEYFSYAQMNESKVTSGTTAEKAKHFIKLGSYLIAEFCIMGNFPSQSRNSFFAAFNISPFAVGLNITVCTGRDGAVQAQLYFFVKAIYCSTAICPVAVRIGVIGVNQHFASSFLQICKRRIRRL